MAHSSLLLVVNDLDKRGGNESDKDIRTIVQLLAKYDNFSTAIKLYVISVVCISANWYRRPE